MNKYKKLRKEINISQAQLAEMLGVSQTAISQWETDKNYPDVATLKSLSEIFCVSTDYLLDLDQSRIKETNEAVVYTRIPAGTNWGTNIYRDGQIELSAALISKGHDFIAYKITDDRLAPVFKDNDICIIELNDHCDDGNIVLVQIAGYDAELKTVYHSNDGTYIQSVIAGERARFFPNNQKEQPRILGILRELRRFY